jgi:hypothetical protein
MENNTELINVYQHEISFKRRKRIALSYQIREIDKEIRIREDWIEKLEWEDSDNE